MQHVKYLAKILLLSLIAMVPLWQLSAVAEEHQSPSAEQQVSVININTATAEQLSDTLNGVGLKRAENIVKYRDTNGDFSSIDQLLAVKGIGEKVLEKNRERIVLK